MASWDQAPRSGQISSCSAAACIIARTSSRVMLRMRGRSAAKGLAASRTTSAWARSSWWSGIGSSRFPVGKLLQRLPQVLRGGCSGDDNAYRQGSIWDPRHRAALEPVAIDVVVYLNKHFSDAGSTQLELEALRIIQARLDQFDDAVRR